PGELTRIAPVLDIVEPRAKDDSGATAFPGFLGPATNCGSGLTHILRGVAVVAVAELPGIQEGLIDMSDMARPFSPFASTCNLVLVFRSHSGCDRSIADQAIRTTTLKIAEHLGTLTRGCAADETECWEWPLPA